MKLSRQYREFEMLNYNINIPPDYDDKDPYGFIVGKKKTHKKINLSGKKRMFKRI